MAKQSFLMYMDYQEHLELLTEEEIGKLVLALFRYTKDGSLPDWPKEDRSFAALFMAFSFIRKQMDRDRDRYEETCAKNKENVQKRWGKNTKSPKNIPADTKSYEDIPDDTTVYDRIPSDTKPYESIPSDTKRYYKDNDNDKDKENDIDNNKYIVRPAAPSGRNIDGNPHSLILKKQTDEAFDHFWLIYPRHEKKAKSKEKFAALTKSGVPPDEIISGAQRFAEWCKRNSKEPQFIPHPLTWLNQRRWEDELIDDVMPLSAFDKQRQQDRMRQNEAADRLKRLLGGGDSWST